MRRRVWFHRVSAIVWALALIPAWIWWRESVLFVIVASIYANTKSDWSAAEAADDRALIERLDRIEQLLRRGR
jgi:membrane protein implicated in regulation of membrane protease activity